MSGEKNKFSNFISSVKLALSDKDFSLSSLPMMTLVLIIITIVIPVLIGCTLLLATFILLHPITSLYKIINKKLNKRSAND